MWNQKLMPSVKVFLSFENFLFWVTLFITFPNACADGQWAEVEPFC